MDDERHELDPASSPRQRITGDTGNTGNLLALINGAFASIGGIYLATKSVTITAIAGCVALVLAGLLVAKR